MDTTSTFLIGYEHDDGECSITFNGKDKSADFNADICLFREEFADYQKEDYRENLYSPNNGTASKRDMQDSKIRDVSHGNHHENISYNFNSTQILIK